MWCGAGRPTSSPQAAHLVVLQHLGGSLLVRDGQPDVGEGGGVVAQPQAHLHVHGLADRSCHRVRCFTSYSSSGAHQVCLWQMLAVRQLPGCLLGQVGLEGLSAEWSTRGWHSPKAG